MIYSKQLPSGFRELCGILSGPTLFVSQCTHQIIQTLSYIIIELALKAPITTATDDKFCDIFPYFRKKNKVWYFMRIVCQQTILMKYHALFVIFEKAAKFEIVLFCKL